MEYLTIVVNNVVSELDNNKELLKRIEREDPENVNLVHKITERISYLRKLLEFLLEVQAGIEMEDIDLREKLEEITTEVQKDFDTIKRFLDETSAREIDFDFVIKKINETKVKRNFAIYLINVIHNIDDVEEEDYVDDVEEYIKWN